MVVSDRPAGGMAGGDCRRLLAGGGPAFWRGSRTALKAAIGKRRPHARTGGIAPCGTLGVMWRTLLAVFGGWVAIQILVMASDEILIRIVRGQPDAGLMVSGRMAAARLLLGAVCTMIGGWLTARLAPERPWRHAAYLIVLGETMGLVYAASSVGELPLWYIAALLVVYPPAVLAGAWWRLRGATAA